MVSYVKTTAVSLRKGTTAENLAFTGISGELVADLGEDGLGTDINTTLRLHNGITQGGIPMAKADLTNVTTKALAENRDIYGDKNLAYADLSNIEALSDSTAINLVFQTLHGYGLASEEQLEELGDSKANVTMDNIDTASLATDAGHAGKNLAYQDMSNVDTANLATTDSNHTGKNLAYYDSSNVNTTNLTLSTATRPATMGGPVIAAADMSNISDETLNNRLIDNNVEYTTNKKDIIDTSSSSTHINYPTINAVTSYVNESIDDLVNDYATINFDNVIDWNRLYEKNDEIIKYNNDSSEILTAGTGFTVSVNDSRHDFPTIAPTSYDLLDTVPLKLAVYQSEVDPNFPSDPAVPGIYRLQPEYGKTDLTAYDEIKFVNNHGSTITSDFYCKPHPSISGIYCYFVNIKAEDVIGPDGTRATAEGWKGFYDIENLDNTPVYDNLNNFNVQQILLVQPTVVNSGAITEFNYLPSETLNTVEDVNVTVYHPMLIDRTDNDTPTFAVQSGNNATLDLDTITETPGAGVIRTDFDNLPGATAYDKVCNADAAWTINKEDAIPAVTEPSIPEREYNRIATIGQVWDCAKKIDSKITFRSWS